MATSQQYSLRWNNYLRHITYAFDNLRTNDEFVDVTLCCDGRKIKAHKVLLSACSGYFKEIFKENPHPHPVIIFKFIKFDDLNSIIEFMYQGEVNVQQEALQSFLQTAEILAVQGLTSEDKEKPKAPKPVLEEHHIIKTIPSTIRAITESNTQTQTIELQPQNILPHASSPPLSSSMKKRKIAFTEDDDVYTTETVEFPKDDSTNANSTTTIVKAEMQYLPTSVKMDMPEYLDVSDANALSDGTTQVQNTSQDNEQSVAQFTSEYEILTESEIDEKFQHTESGDNSEIQTIEMGRILTSQESSESIKEEKGSTAQALPTSADESSLRCSVCKRRLQSVSALRRHIESKHSERLVKFDCTTCHKSFKTKWSLSTHNSRFHRDNRVKECIKMEFNVE